MRTAQQAAANRKELWRQLRRDEREKERAKVGSLSDQLRTLKARRRQAIANAKALCRAERIAARERVKMLRERARLDLRAAAEAERSAARGVCTVELGEAQSLKGDVERARVELDAEKRFQRDMRRIEGANRARRGERRTSKREKRSESDDEVRSNIPEELIPLFERVKGAIVATPRMSRTEAFLKYAEEHPEEVIDLGDVDARTDALIAELERQQRAGRRNPTRRSQGNPLLVELGKLTELTWEGGGKRQWSLSRAPSLIYDESGRRLLIVYASRSVGEATSAETREYARTHWGQRGLGDVRAGDVAVPPWRELGRGISITYT
ncbi:MAG TPA: hypothetical protein VM925_21825, partial [Labilithrix sp.]|nr:hypothetical protein [Labilithrix sp.]